MNNVVLKNIARFIILVLIQVFVLNNIRIGGYINPYLYVLFILLLPFEIPGWLLLLSSFLLGFSIDFFVHTPGLHTAASVFTAFCRPGLIRIISRNKTIEPGSSPQLRDMGFNWFFVYSLVLIFLHHSLLFFLEVFRLSEFFDTLIRIGLSTIATLVLVFVVEYLFINKKDKD